jgi:hypothetical protein
MTAKKVRRKYLKSNNFGVNVIFTLSHRLRFSRMRFQSFANFATADSTALNRADVRLGRVKLAGFDENSQGTPGGRSSA